VGHSSGRPASKGTFRFRFWDPAELPCALPCSPSLRPWIGNRVVSPSLPPPRVRPSAQLSSSPVLNPETHAEPLHRVRVRETISASVSTWMCPARAHTHTHTHTADQPASRLCRLPGNDTCTRAQNTLPFCAVFLPPPELRRL